MHEYEEMRSFSVTMVRLPLRGAAGGGLWKKLFLKIFQYLQEISCVKVSF